MWQDLKRVFIQETKQFWKPVFHPIQFYQEMKKDIQDLKAWYAKRKNRE